MSTIRYLHCADLHIGSPFKGISKLHPAFRDKLYDSTYQSFSNIMDLAILEEVDFVAICGDVYDSADKSLKAQLHFRDGMRKLAEAGIPAYVVHGNHDPIDGWSASLQWPDTARIFGGDAVGHFDVQRDGATIARVYGISYKVRDVSDNLAQLFDHQGADIPAIVLLHANVGSNSAHKEYAPASIGVAHLLRWVLVSNRYDDGGFTGGNIDRPTLSQLIADIRQGLIAGVPPFKVGFGQIDGGL